MKTEVLTVASKVADVEVNPDNTKYMFICCKYNEGQNRDIKQCKKSSKVPQIPNI